MDRTESFYTHLGVIVDCLYRSLDHYDVIKHNANEVKKVKKESVFQIDACQSTDCTDFNFKGSSTFSSTFKF